MNDELSTFNPEAAFHEAPLSLDPGDFYALPLQAQEIMERLMHVAGIDPDRTTLIAFTDEAIGFWHHNAVNTELVTHFTKTGTKTYTLGDMDRAL